jgi:hypothetical protein
VKDNPFKTWMQESTAEEKRALAAAAGTTYDNLYQMAKAYRTGGKVSVTPDMARRLEKASKGALRREDLCPACGRCDLAEKARKK